MIFDTHAHYDDKRFDADRRDVLAAMPEKGVSLILNPGCDGESSRAACALADEFSFVYAAVGWHPAVDGQHELQKNESEKTVSAIVFSSLVPAILCTRQILP